MIHCNADRCEQGRKPCPCPEQCDDMDAGDRIVLSIALLGSILVCIFVILALLGVI
jgi:hypothetical protein